MTLLAGTPRRFRRSEARKRIDNSCHGGGRGNTGVALWEGSYVLSEWLSRQHQPEEAAASCSMLEALGCNGNPLLPAAGETGKQRPLAVELGAGLGLPSIVASNMGFDVVATDGDLSALELLASNIKRNSPKGAVARAEQLVWGSPDPKSALGLRASPDLILAADVVYGNDPKAWQSLLHTIASLANENTLMLLANMQR